MQSSGRPTIRLITAPKSTLAHARRNATEDLRHTPPRDESRLDRQWAAHVAHRLGTTEYTGVLVALTDDQDVAVRATAASALSVLVADDTGGPLAATVPSRRATSAGRFDGADCTGQADTSILVGNNRQHVRRRDRGTVWGVDRWLY